MHGIRYKVDEIASYIVHGHPPLAGKLEQLHPVHQQEEIAALMDAVARSFWHRNRGIPRRKRYDMAERVVYDALVTMPDGLGHRH